MSTITEIKNLIDDLIDTSTSTFADVRKVRGLNRAQKKIVKIIKKTDNLREWDDNNWSDLPEGLLDIVSGQSVYDISQDENNANIVQVFEVYIKTSASATEFTKLDKTHKTVTSETGIPTEYRLSGKSLIVSPEPDYSLSEGIKLVFMREPEPITTSDTVKEPGVPSLFHDLLALYTAYDYARAKNLASKNDILAEIQKEEQELGISIGDNQSTDIDNVVMNHIIESI